MTIPFRRALISVYDKTGVEELAQALHGVGCEIVSTGSTAAKIQAAGIPVTPVDKVTGFPECFDGRVKTLHPKIHGGILANRELNTHLAQLEELEITPIDLVVVNLYPFLETVSSGASPEECVEQIDIGGPTMVRAAAKNYRSVAVVVDPANYQRVIDAADTGFDLATRAELAAAAFAHTASYDVAVAQWVAREIACQEPTKFVGGAWELAHELRYGENPHQSAALYTHGTGGLANATQLGGKEMSYNNYQDTDAAIRAAYDHSEPCVAVIKHANPCGIGVATDIATAHAKAHACDPQSAYGGVIAANRTVTLAMAQQVRPIFTEVIAAPDFEPEALELLQEKKKLRILRVEPQLEAQQLRPISGGLLVQDTDRIDADGDSSENWELVAGTAADADTLADLEFAWRAVRSVKSNAILLADQGATVGIGMGQVNRVDSCRLAVERANTLGKVSDTEPAPERARGAVAASDAFFPFADGFEVLTQAGVRAVVQPGGSIRDNEVVAAAQKTGVTMYFTHTRHFAH